MHTTWPSVETVKTKSPATSGVWIPGMLRVQARERRQKRRMDIENPLREGADKVGAENAHIPGQNHPVHFVLAESVDELAIIRFPVQALRRQRQRV